MVKTDPELQRMRASGRLLASVFDMLDGLPLRGLSTLQVNDAVERFITVDLDARPASKGQYGYGYALNCSVNDVVCHGVPSARAVLRDGDIVNFDVTLEKDGFIADSSKTYIVGAAAPKTKRLVDVARGAMWAGVRAVRPGARLGDVGHAIERHARMRGCAVVREYCGHGIGRRLHEPPNVLNFGRRGTGLTLRPGMVFTVEPMVNQGSRAVVADEIDGWSTVRTRDGRLSAQFEHTVAVTADGVEVLTLRAEERRSAAGRSDRGASNAP